MYYDMNIQLNLNVNRFCNLKIFIDKQKEIYKFNNSRFDNYQICPND